MQAPAEPPAHPPFEPTQSRLILVEDEVHETLLRAVAVDMGLAMPVEYVRYDGTTELKRFLKALVRTAGFRSVTNLGVVRDADEQPAGAFASVRDALAAAGLVAPAQPVTAGPGNPAVAVMIFPDPTTTGSAEDLCARAFTGDPAEPCVAAYFTCLEAAGVAPAGDMSKRRMVVFLASRAEFKPKLTWAIAAGAIPLNDAFDQTRAFLQLVAA